MRTLIIARTGNSAYKFIFIVLLLIISSIFIEKANAQTCNPGTPLQGTEAPKDQCDPTVDDCCMAGHSYATYNCSPPVSGSTKAVLTLNSFAKGGDGGGPSECDNQYHSDTTRVAALSTGWYNRGSRCGKRIVISVNNKTTMAMVVDECDSQRGCDGEHGFQRPCDNNIVAASKAVWSALGVSPNSDQYGLMPITWSDAHVVSEPLGSPSPSSSAYPSPSSRQSSPPPAVTSPKKSANPPSMSNSKRKRTVLLVGLLSSALLSILLLYGVLTCLRKKKVIQKSTNLEAYEIKEAVTESLQFDLHTLRTATNNFSVDNKLGEGGFGEVYKGKLENGQEIAVKRLSKNSGQGVAEFKTEVVLVAKLRHKNLVKLLGYCVALEEKILVYEFLPNSSLDRILFDQNRKSSLDWQIRFNIIAGIARGLLYLHEDSPLKVIHRDLKSSNILLDEDMNPKISDFGLAKLCDVDQTQGDTKRIVGTYGYMAPEYAITGHYSVKSDVYSFGVIVLEIVSGQRNRFLGRLQLEEAILHRAWRLWNEGKTLDLIDATLSNNFPKEEAIKCMHIGLLCIQEDATVRPKMTSIVAALNGQITSLPMPNPPNFFGTAKNFVDDEVPGYSLDAYTGINTITDLYPRD